MKNDKIKKAEQLLDGVGDYIILTPNGYNITGNTPALLALYSGLTRKMLELKGSSKEFVEKAFELGFKNTDEIKEVLIEEFAKFLKRMEEEKEDE